MALALMDLVVGPAQAGPVTAVDDGPFRVVFVVSVRSEALSPCGDGAHCDFCSV
jgi:hypothetical protein